MHDSQVPETQIVTVGVRRRLTVAQVAKLHTAPMLTLVESEVNALFPEPDVRFSIEYKNAEGEVIDVEDLSPGFQAEAAAAAYLDMLALQILELKQRLHLYFTYHAEVEAAAYAAACLPGNNGPSALAADTPHLQRRSGAGETVT